MPVVPRLRLLIQQDGDELYSDSWCSQRYLVFTSWFNEMGLKPFSWCSQWYLVLFFLVQRDGVKLLCFMVFLVVPRLRLMVQEEEKLYSLNAFPLRLLVQ